MTTQHGVLQLNCCSYDRNVLLLLVNITVTNKNTFLKKFLKYALYICV